MSIYPDRKDGKLTGRFRVEVQVGHRRKRGRADSLAEARQMEADLRKALKEGGEIAPRLRTVSETFRALTLGEAATRAKPLLWAGQDTEAASQRKLDRVVKMVGPEKSLDAFDANTVDQVVVELKSTGCSDATINRYLSNISAFLKFCFKRGFRTNPLFELDWRDEGEGRIRWITYAEERKLLLLLPYPFNEIAYVAIRTGMRVSEILSLKPDQLTADWVHLWETKNDSARSVPLNKDLYQRLAPLVLTGTMPDYWELRYQWDIAREAMGLAGDPLFVFHACRHTFATRAVQKGVPLRVLQELLGHKTIEMTERYAHVYDEMKLDARDRMFGKAKVLIAA